MNNREWLYSLDVADLSDWFDAEHEPEPEPQEGEYSAQRLAKLLRQRDDALKEVDDLRAKVYWLERRLQIVKEVAK